MTWWKGLRSLSSVRVAAGAGFAGGAEAAACAVGASKLAGRMKGHALSSYRRSHSHTRRCGFFLRSIGVSTGCSEPRHLFSLLMVLPLLKSRSTSARKPSESTEKLP